jgi:hypothetical protein
MWHWCGSPIHDVIHNFMVLIISAPDWLPWAVHWKVAAQTHLKQETHNGQS